MKIISAREILLFFSEKLTRVEVLAIAVVLLWGFSSDIHTVEFIGDENFWIVSSVRLDMLLAGEFDSPLWTENPIIIFEVRPVPSYFAGIGQRLGGIQPGDLPSVYWNWSLSDAENAARGAMPSSAVLWWSRIPMAVITALVLLGSAVFLGRIYSRIAAYVFTLISFSPYFLDNLRRSMSEASILFFTILAMLASYKLLITLRGDSLKKTILWSVVVGVAAALPVNQS